jgi:TP901 family phage tail tape measure protein
MSNIIRSFIVRTGVDMSGMTVGLSKLSSDLKRAGKQITATGQDLTRNLTVPMLAVGTASLKFASDFEDSMAAVSTVANTAVKSIGELSDGVMELSGKTGKAASEVGDALYLAISSGADTANALELVGAASKIAVTGFTDTTTAVDGLTSVLNAYNMETSEANRIANLFQVTQDVGKSTVDELAQSIGNVTSISATAGVSIESLLSAIATLSLNGIKTDEAITGVKSAISNIIKPSEQAAEVAAMLGLDFSATALQAKGLSAFLADVQEKTGGNIETMATLFGNVRGLNAMLKLTSSGGMEVFNDTLQEMQTNTTSLDNAYEIMTSTMSNQMKIALNSLKNVGIELGQKLMPIVNNGIIPAIKSFGEWVGNLIDKFNNLSPFMQDMVTLALAITVAIGPLTTVVGKLMITMGSLVKSFQLAQMALAGGSGFMGAITTFLGPAGTVVLAIAAIAAVVGTLVIAFNNANAETKALKKEIQDFNDSVNQSKETFDDLIEKNNASAGAAKTLADELYNLADKENKSTAEKMRMKDIVNQLNSMYEGLNLTIDEITGTLNLEKKAIEDVIDANLKQIQLSAYSERLTELYEEQYEAAEKLKNVTKSMSDEQVAIAEDVKNNIYYQEAYNKAMEDGTITADELRRSSKYLAGIFNDDLINAYLEASMVQDQNTEAVHNATEAYNNLAIEVSDSSSTIQGAGASWDALSETQKAALEEMGTTQENYTAMSIEDLQAYADEMQKQQEEYEDLLDERLAVTQNAFEKIESTIDVSLDEMIKNLESNQELVSTWTDNLAILTDKGLNSGFIQVLEDAGVDAAVTVANLVDASDAEIQRLNDVFMNGSTVAIDSMKKELGLDTTVNVGSDTISEIADGVENNTEFENAAKKQVKDAKSAMATQVKESNFSTIGSSMISGTINGMNSLGGKLRSTAQSLARSAYNAMKNALDIHSPSKKTMEIGQFFVGGLTEGIAKSARQAIWKARELSSNLVGALSFGSVQFPSVSDYGVPSALQTSGLSNSVIQNTTNTSSRETNVRVEFTGPVMLGNEMDIDKVATMLGYYLQNKPVAQGA